VNDIDALRLFVVMLGGRYPRANIEQHDVVFAVAERIEDSYPQLRVQWGGITQGLHLDSWLRVDGVEGYQIRLSVRPPPQSSPRLYFLNLGGYVAGQFGEAHSYRLVVADDAATAKRKALDACDGGWIKPHRDALLEVDDCLALGPIGGLHVHLLPGPHKGVSCHSDYIVIS
jgi:hypothetical protein